MKFVALPLITIQYVKNRLCSFAYSNGEEIHHHAFELPITKAVCDGNEELVKNLLGQDPGSCLATESTEQCYPIRRQIFPSNSLRHSMSLAGLCTSVLDLEKILGYSTLHELFVIALQKLQFRTALVLLQSFDVTTATSRLCRQRMSEDKGLHQLDALRMLLCYCRDEQLRRSTVQRLMYWAIKLENADTICDLLRLGADLKLGFSLEKTTFLHVAALHYNHDIFQLLVENGADVDALDDNGETPLFHAVRLNIFRLTEQLIHFGANVNAQNLDFKTPLHIAAGSVYNSTRLVNLLLKNGAYFNIRDAFGDTPLSLSRYQRWLKGSFSTTKCLIQHGSLPTRMNEFETILLALEDAKAGENAVFLKRAGFERLLDDFLLADTGSLKALCSGNLGHPTANLVQFYMAKFHMHSSPESLYNACHLVIRRLLAKISNGRSICDMVRALPLPDLICRDLLLEEHAESKVA